MEAIEILIADSLADSLSRFTFPGAISSVTAVRRLVPDDTTEDISQLKVSVVPGALEVNPNTRESDLFEPTIHVVIAKKFSTDAELDELIDLRSNILDAIRSNVLPASNPPMPPQTRWFSIGNDVTFSRDHVADMRTFLADIAVVYRRAQEKVG